MSRFLACLLLATAVAAGQTPPAPRSGTQPGTAPSAAPSSPESVPPNATVITINACEGSEKQPPPAKSAKECTKVVTKAQFEELLKAFGGQVAPQMRRPLALNYAQALVMEDKAIEMGLDKAPETEAQLKIVRLQALASAYNRYLQQQVALTSPQEIENYYKQKPQQFEEITLKQIYIPKGKPTEEAAKATAEKVRQRAAAGEDFDKLQQEVNGDPKTPAHTEVGPRRRGTFPPEIEEKVFALKAGEVSDVLPAGAGFFIYKVVSKQLLPLDGVKDEIARRLQRQKYEEAMAKLRNSVKTDLNPSYFGEPPPQASAPPAPTPK